METIEGFVNFVYFINFWTREQAQSQVCKHAERTTNVINGHCKVSITVHKANGIKQMSQTRTPGQSKSCFGKRQFQRRGGSSTLNFKNYGCQHILVIYTFLSVVRMRESTRPTRLTETTFKLCYHFGRVV